LKIRKVAPQNLTEDEVKKCKSLSLRSKGEMSKSLTQLIKDDSHKGMCYLIKNNKKLIAWALVYFHKENDKTYAHFYVRKSERRNGFGKKLAKKVKKDYKNPVGAKGDSVSESFFKNVNYETIDVSEEK